MHVEVSGDKALPIQVSDSESEWEDDESGEGDSESEWDADGIDGEDAVAGTHGRVMKQGFFSEFIGKPTHRDIPSDCLERVCSHASCDQGICTYVRKIKARSMQGWGGIPCSHTHR